MKFAEKSPPNRSNLSRTVQCLCAMVVGLLSGFRNNGPFHLIVRADRVIFLLFP